MAWTLLACVLSLHHVTAVRLSVPRPPIVAVLRLKARAPVGTVALCSDTVSGRKLLNPRQLNKRISDAESADTIMKLHAQHGGSFDEIHLSTCWSRLGKVARGADAFRLQRDPELLAPLTEQTAVAMDGFGARALSTTAHAVAKLRFTGSPYTRLWEAMRARALLCRGDLNAQGLANTAWAFATADRSEPDLFNALAEEAIPQLPDFSPQALANIVWAFASSSRHAPRLFVAVAAEAPPRLPGFSPQAIAMVAWSFASAGVPAPALFDALAAEVTPRVADCAPQALANLAWAFAVTGHARRVPSLLKAIAAEATLPARLRMFKPQELAHLAWAYAKVGHASPELFRVIASETTRRRAEFGTQELATVAWACASARHASPELFRAIASEAERRADDFSPQAISNTVWAFARVAQPSSAMFDALGARAASNSDAFSPQALVNTAWAFATVGHKDPELFDVIAAVSQQQLGRFKQQEISNLAWAFARSAHPAPSLFDALAAEAAPRLQSFNEQALANLAWAFATAGHKAPVLLDALAAEAAPRLGQFTPQALSLTAWAFATAGHPAPLFFRAIAEQAAPRLASFQPQAMANLAWAYAVVDEAEAGAALFAEAFGRRCDTLAARFNPVELTQLHLWLLWQQGECGRTSGLPGPQLRAQCRDQFVAMLNRPSALQQHVGQGLADLGMRPRAEVTISQGYSVDFVVEWQGQTVAVEVDGPSHFAARSALSTPEQQTTPTSATLLKRRQLRRFGWRLVSVPYWEWDGLGDDRGRRTCTTQQLEYLTELLDGAVEAEGAHPMDSGGIGRGASEAWGSADEVGASRGKSSKRAGAR